MSVRFKFKNDLDFSAVPCDGFNISVRDLKRSIIRMKRLGRVTDFDLDVINQQDNSPIEDEDALIAKNSTLIIVRKPLLKGQQKVWEDDKAPILAGSQSGVGSGGQSGFLGGSNSNKDDLTEDDRINQAISNSSELYSQKNWISYRGKAAGGKPPMSYRCARCHQPGHWKDDCLLSKSGFNGAELKKTTGIPRSFLTPADKNTPGAKINPQGIFMVNELEKKAYTTNKVDKPLWDSEEASLTTMPKVEIPEDLKCSICTDLFRDCVMTPICAHSFCDECVRNALIESENNTCPQCKEPDNNPDELIPVRMIRVQVEKFKSSHGYSLKSQPGTPKQDSATIASKLPTLPDIVLPKTSEFDKLVKGQPTPPGSTSPQYGENSPASSPFTSPKFAENFPEPSAPGEDDFDPNLFPDPKKKEDSATPAASPGTPLGTPSPARSPVVKVAVIKDEVSSSRSPKRKRSRSPSPSSEPRSRTVPLPDISKPPPAFFPGMLPVSVPTHHPYPPRSSAPSYYQRAGRGGGYRGRGGYHRHHPGGGEPDIVNEFERIMAQKDRMRGRSPPRSPPGSSRYYHHRPYSRSPPPHSGHRRYPPSPPLRKHYRSPGRSPYQSPPRLSRSPSYSRHGAPGAPLSPRGPRTPPHPPGESPKHVGEEDSPKASPRLRSSSMSREKLPLGPERRRTISPSRRDNEYSRSLSRERHVPGNSPRRVTARHSPPPLQPPPRGRSRSPHSRNRTYDPMDPRHPRFRENKRREEPPVSRRYEEPGNRKYPREERFLEESAHVDKDRTPSLSPEPEFRREINESQRHVPDHRPRGGSRGHFPNDHRRDRYRDTGSRFERSREDGYRTRRDPPPPTQSSADYKKSRFFDDGAELRHLNDDGRKRSRERDQVERKDDEHRRRGDGREAVIKSDSRDRNQTRHEENRDSEKRERKSPEDLSKKSSSIRENEDVKDVKKKKKKKKKKEEVSESENNSDKNEDSSKKKKKKSKKLKEKVTLPTASKKTSSSTGADPKEPEEKTKETKVAETAVEIKQQEKIKLPQPPPVDNQQPGTEANDLIDDELQLHPDSKDLIGDTSHHSKWDSAHTDEDENAREAAAKVEQVKDKDLRELLKERKENVKQQQVVLSRDEGTPPPKHPEVEDHEDLEEEEDSEKLSKKKNKKKKKKTKKKHESESEENNESEGNSEESEEKMRKKKKRDKKYKKMKKEMKKMKDALQSIVVKSKTSKKSTSPPPSPPSQPRTDGSRKRHRSPSPVRRRSPSPARRSPSSSKRRSPDRAAGRNVRGLGEGLQITLKSKRRHSRSRSKSHVDDSPVQRKLMRLSGTSSKHVVESSSSSSKKLSVKDRLGPKPSDKMKKGKNSIRARGSRGNRASSPAANNRSESRNHERKRSRSRDRDDRSKRHRSGRR